MSPPLHCWTDDPDGASFSKANTLWSTAFLSSQVKSSPRAAAAGVTGRGNSTRWPEMAWSSDAHDRRGTESTM
ncbi:hypothetical protein BP6252_11575 [Coleophoma cylindrospora]|uniref:Uncharacterized protein n=1 Tax=Coleophoma cylindrospora TaxID=1849047 RepID=A0A3D8QK08_9HELO|nr:hypothetical protein BP6252_11575 [Coleophoma cylindrospora]